MPNPKRTILLLIAATLGCGRGGDTPPASGTAGASAAAGESAQPQEVVFWHFWGGEDRPVVQEIARRFNASQTRYRVRPVAMPGNNLELKFFLSVAGGDPPDVINQDDAILPDWAERGALTPLDELAPPEEVERTAAWLFPAARRLATYRGRLYALPNGLDIRALFYNATWLHELGLSTPATLAELDALAERVAPAEGRGQPLQRVGYLPDPRRLWAWAVVFGGRFWDPEATTADAAITLDCPENLAALRWMASYRDRYGAEAIAAFRTGDQALTGARFPLFGRRYAAIMDGQWRVRDIVRAEAERERRGGVGDVYGVAPLPPPPGGRRRAGWVNGNFFLVPRGAKQPEGAWRFMKFWAGLGGQAAEEEAARACVAGGWIPVSQQVVDQPVFQEMLRRRPRFAQLVQLAASPVQVPTPPLPVASFYRREVDAAVQDVMYRNADPEARLGLAATRVRQRLREVWR